MPKVPTDYSRTIIYKICSKDPTISDIYVGHTTDLINRRYCHKSSCYNENKNDYHFYVYQFIRENGGWVAWNVVPIEEYACENVNQARIRERYWIECLKPTLNKNLPSRDIKEFHKAYYQSHKDYSIQKQKKYYEENKEDVKNYLKEWRMKNKEKIKIANNEWRTTNKEYKSKKDKEYYEKNKLKLQQKYECDCGGSYTTANQSRHLKTKKHQSYLSSLS